MPGAVIVLYCGVLHSYSTSYIHNHLLHQDNSLSLFSIYYSLFTLEYSQSIVHFTPIYTCEVFLLAHYLFVINTRESGNCCWGCKMFLNHSDLPYSLYSLTIPLIWSSFVLSIRSTMILWSSLSWFVHCTKCWYGILVVWIVDTGELMHVIVCAWKVNDLIYQIL